MENPASSEDDQSVQQIVFAVSAICSISGLNSSDKLAVYLIYGNQLMLSSSIYKRSGEGKPVRFLVTAMVFVRSLAFIQLLIKF